MQRSPWVSALRLQFYSVPYLLSVGILISILIGCLHFWGVILVFRKTCSLQLCQHEISAQGQTVNPFPPIGKQLLPCIIPLPSVQLPLNVQYSLFLQKTFRSKILYATYFPGKDIGHTKDFSSSSMFHLIWGQASNCTSSAI